MGLALSPLSLVLCAAALVAATSASLASASPHILQKTTKARIPDDACAFRAYEIQLCNATADQLPPFTAVYLQVNKVFAADGGVAVDVAALRPRQSYNSYQKLEPREVFEVAKLETGEKLTVELSDSLGLKFVYGEWEWSLRDEVAEEEKAWCEVGEWSGDDEDWTCEIGSDKKNRKRNLTCGFPCAEQESAELR